MDRLPEDVIMDILSRLPMKSLLRCRCVCKFWLNLTHRPSFIHQHLHRSSYPYQENPPNLILNTTRSITTVNSQTHLLLAEPQHTHDYTCSNLHFSIPNFEEFRIMGSCNGLLCLSHRSNRYPFYVCNPFVRQYAKLPNPIDPLSPHYTLADLVVGFGFDPGKNVFKVLQILYWLNRNELRVEAFVLTLGDGSWRLVEKAPKMCVSGQNALGASVNGVLHWAASNSLEDPIVSFDIGDEVFHSVPCGPVGIDNFQYSLGVMEGCLAVVKSSFVCRIDIWVMKEYGIEESWTKNFTMNFNQLLLNIKYINPLCCLKDGEVLLLYKTRALLSFDLSTKTFRKRSIAGVPAWFEAVTFVPTLISPTCL